MNPDSCARRLLVKLALGAASLVTTNHAVSCELEQVIHGDSSDVAVVLVPGIGEGRTAFEPWLPALLRQGATVLFARCDHHGASMTTNALTLTQNLDVLPLAPTTRLVVLAHSMGGLVALQAVRGLPSGRYDRVALHTYGTPFGGFYLANFARWLPGAGTVAGWLGFPMSVEIGSTSPFMTALAKPLPEGVELNIVDSHEDKVARPETAAACEDYKTMLARSTDVQHLVGIKHAEYMAQLPAPDLK